MKSAILLIAVFFTVGSAEALSTATATATLDWTGFTWTTDGTLTVTRIDFSDPGSGFTRTRQTPSTAIGTSSALATEVNGFLTSHTEAATLSETPWQANRAEAIAEGSSIFWLYGSGVGGLTVSIPYHLALAIDAENALDLTAGEAWVWLATGPGVTNGGWTEQRLTLDATGAVSQDGVLTLTRSFVNPTWGPLVGIRAHAETSAEATVPEPSSLALLALGVVALGVMGRWSEQR
jgi:hypothetical protein